MATQKKQLERMYLDRFRAICAEFPAGYIEDSEQPDFLIRGSTATLGIEITELLRPPDGGAKSMREQEAIRGQIIERALRKYEATGNAPLCVRVTFSRGDDLSMPQVPALADDLAKIVMENIPELGGTFEVNQRDWSESLELPDDFDCVRISRPRPITKHDWFEPRAEFEMPCSAPLIQQRLDEKEPKVGVYRACCDHVWLLIVADGFAHSSVFDFGEEVLRASYKTSFDRVYLYRNFEHWCKELQRCCNQTGR